MLPSSCCSALHDTHSRHSAQHCVLLLTGTALSSTTTTLVVALVSQRPNSRTLSSSVIIMHLGTPLDHMPASSWLHQLSPSHANSPKTCLNEAANYTIQCCMLPDTTISNGSSSQVMGWLGTHPQHHTSAHHPSPSTLPSAVLHPEPSSCCAPALQLATWTECASAWLSLSQRTQLVGRCCTHDAADSCSGLAARRAPLQCLRSTRHWRSRWLQCAARQLTGCLRCVQGRTGTVPHEVLAAACARCAHSMHISMHHDPVHPSQEPAAQPPTPRQPAYTISTQLESRCFLPSHMYHAHHHGF